MMENLLMGERGSDFLLDQKVKTLSITITWLFSINDSSLIFSFGTDDLNCYTPRLKSQ